MSHRNHEHDAREPQELALGLQKAEQVSSLCTFVPAAFILLAPMFKQDVNAFFKDVMARIARKDKARLPALPMIHTRPVVIT